MKTILAVGGDPGGANALAPVLEALLQDESFLIRPFAYNEALTIWKQRGLDPGELKGSPSDEIIRRIVMETGPDLLLAATSVNSKEFEKYFIREARLQHVPSLSVLDHWSNYSIRYSDVGEKLVFLPDRIAVMDDRARTEMAAGGFDPGSLVVTGQPAFDELGAWRSRFDNTARQGVRHGLGIGDRALAIVFASEPCLPVPGGPRGWQGYRKEDVLPDLISALESISRENAKTIVLVIRPHPREDPREFDRYGSETIRIVLSTTGHSRDIVMASDLVTGMSTNLLAEACYLGCVVASLQPRPGPADPVITNRSGHSTGVYDKKDFKPVIQKLLLDLPARKRIQDRLRTFRTDGKASRRIVSLIHTMIGD